MNDGPQLGNPAGDTDNIELLLVRTTVPDSGGAHLNESVALAEPWTCEKLMVIGFEVQITFGVPSGAEYALTTYVPTTTRATVIPRRIWCAYRCNDSRPGPGGISI